MSPMHSLAKCPLAKWALAKWERKYLRGNENICVGTKTICVGTQIFAFERRFCNIFHSSPLESSVGSQSRCENWKYVPAVPGLEGEDDHTDKARGGDDGHSMA